MNLYLPEKSVIKVAKGLSYKICHDLNTVKNMALFYQLKSFYVGGVILNYARRRFIIGEMCGLSEGTLRKRIGELKRMGLVKMNGKHLELRSNKLVREIFDLHEKLKSTIKFNFRKNCTEGIIALGIDENIHRQAYILKKKLIDDKVDRVGIKETRSVNKIKRFRRKNFENICAKQLRRNSKSILNNKLSKVNAQTTLSRQGIATFIGRKSKCTGSRWAKKLRELSFITDERVDEIIYRGVHYHDYIKMNLGYRCSWKNGFISLRLSNQLVVKLR